MKTSFKKGNKFQKGVNFSYWYYLDNAKFPSKSQKTKTKECSLYLASSYSSSSHFSNFFHRSNYSQTSSSSASTSSLIHLNNHLNDTTLTENLKDATQIHAQLLKNDNIFLPFLFANFLNSCARCGLINRSLLLFSTAGEDVSKNFVAWTTDVA
ncbi:hypothetical protein PanWU01x14_086910 [Parasponia andersonii]|uniref:Pentatricopeptide repeat n=1 Tax=Parasponia andersonii TaxID=3476 RepID=A0A2P5D8I1_PARAD|nr:hypothetical protein PanWU01x14_086910 [Parasponia andersonii]